MKVLSLVYDLIRGGTEGQCARVAMQHARMGLDHRVSVMRKRGFFLEEVDALCGPLYHFDIQKMASIVTVQKVNALARYIATERFDLVHGWDMDAAIFGYPAARKARVPFLTSRRNMGDMLPAHKALMLKRVDRAAAGVVVNAVAIQDRVTSWGCPPSKINVIPNILDVEEFDGQVSVKQSGAEPFVAGIVCRLAPEKNVRVFIYAAELLLKSHPDLRFEIVGDGMERAELEAFVQERGLAGQIAFLGNRSDVPSIISKWNAGVLVPALNEGLSNSILEYFAAGLPCVVTDNGGNRELIEASKAGAVIPVGDAEALATVLSEWIGQPAEATALGQLGRAYVEKTHSPDRIAKLFAEYYETIISDA